MEQGCALSSLRPVSFSSHTTLLLSSATLAVPSHRPMQFGEPVSRVPTGTVVEQTTFLAAVVNAASANVHGWWRTTPNPLSSRSIQTIMQGTCVYVCVRVLGLELIRNVASEDKWCRQRRWSRWFNESGWWWRRRPQFFLGEHFDGVSRRWRRHQKLVPQATQVRHHRVRKSTETFSGLNSELSLTRPRVRLLVVKCTCCELTIFIVQ